MEYPKTSKELKKRILFLEAEKEQDRLRIKNYFAPDSGESKPFNMLQGILLNVKLPMNLKVEAGRALIVWITGFVIKKINSRKEKSVKPEVSDDLVEDAIERAVSRNSNKLNATERKIFKKMLHQYLLAK